MRGLAARERRLSCGQQLSEGGAVQVSPLCGSQSERQRFARSALVEEPEVDQSECHWMADQSLKGACKVAVLAWPALFLPHTRSCMRPIAFRRHHTLRVGRTWEARAKYDGGNKHLGAFTTEHEAGKALAK